MDHECKIFLQLPAECPLTSLAFEDDVAEVLGNPRDNKALPTSSMVIRSVARPSSFSST
jgi:hypothetical protein